MQETRVQSLGQEDALEKGMATHSSMPAWKIPWTDAPGGLQSMGLQRVRPDLMTKQQQFKLRPGHLSSRMLRISPSHLVGLLVPQSWGLSLPTAVSSLLAGPWPGTGSSLQTSV